ncbi:hypothetical protein OC195_16035 [Priestia flexa]|nr:hypothetical protein OC195_16035 [Priestia flexa]
MIATLFLYVSYKLKGNWSTPINNHGDILAFAVSAAVIYWFWDSIIMNRDEYPYY